MRLFLAINPPSEVRRDVVAASAPLRECAPDLAWVDESRIHLTLKFLGECDEERVDDIQAAIAMTAGRHRELLMTVGGMMAFPNFRRARVVGMSVLPEPRLELLHHDIEVACDGLGFEIEGRPFRPHLTLARVKRPLPTERSRELSRRAKSADFRTDFIVRSIDLMQSEMTSAGSKYTTLVSAALPGG